MAINFRGLAPRDFSLGQDGRPTLKENHLSARTGLFICGDLAGNPTLKTSIRDGYEAMRDVAAWLENQETTGRYDCDVVICGAGPAGLSAALEAKDLGLKISIIDKNQPANTIVHFPEAKKIWARQEKVDLDTRLWLDNCTREELLEKWDAIIRSEQLHIRTGCAILGLDAIPGGLAIHTSEGTRMTCRAVLLAIGRSGNPRKLKVPGEDRPFVHHMLLHPKGYEGKRVLVVGGGNSAVEAACALAGRGAQVCISYRQDSFYRATPINRKEIQGHLERGTVQAYFSTQVEQISECSVDLKTGKGIETLPADEVFVLIGAEPPKKLLSKLGVRFENDWPLSRCGLLGASLLLVWLFYAFSKWGDGTRLQEFPFSLLGKAWDRLPGWAAPGLLKTALYTAVVISFGIPALTRWRSKPRITRYQTWRYAVIFFSQGFLLFVAPEFIIKLIDTSNYWRFYGIPMPFPLLYEIFFYRPPTMWLILCGLAAFVVLPVAVYWHGKRLCSWVCGCGCLSETLGDRYRHYAPQGDFSRGIESPIMWAVLAWAFISAALFLTTQGGSGSRPWHVASYIYLVDFWLASVMGVGLYFFWGNRIWCRFFCPLAHYMRLLSAWYGKFRIKPADRCIACSECTRYCQMGIDVMKFALKGQPVNNRNSSCIGCGICVSVCPMDNLTMGDRFPNEGSYDSI